jgi:hypothetical protein
MELKLIAMWPNLIGRVGGSDVAPTNHIAAKKSIKGGTIV